MREGFGASVESVKKDKKEGYAAAFLVLQGFVGDCREGVQLL